MRNEQVKIPSAFKVTVTMKVDVLAFSSSRAEQLAEAVSRETTFALAACDLLKSHQLSVASEYEMTKLHEA